MAYPPDRDDMSRNPANRHAALRENVLESLGDALILTDADDRIILANQSAEELLGTAEQHIVDRPCAVAFAEAPWLPDLVRRVRTSMQSQACGQEMLGQTPVRASCSPILGPGGGLQGTALVLYDLSYQMMLEEEVRRNESLARVGSLVAGLAHEVKNPLGGIKGAAQLLARRLGEMPEVKACTDIMIRETDRLSNLVEQLLVLGGPRKPALVALNVHKVLRSVLDLMAPLAQERGIRVKLEVDPSLPDVAGDEAQLSQVFINLVKNAFEAMNSSGKLTVTTRLDTELRIVRRDPNLRGGGAPAQMVRVSIADTGPGFPAAEMKHLFEPFFTTKSRGTGLGLAICRQIIAAHGGDIRAENRAEGGALVTVTIPWAREAA